MWAQPFRKDDVEAGARPLYPMMLESPELRWAFIRKVYSILTIQLLATIAVGAVVVSVKPIASFFVSTGAGLALYIVVIIMPFLVLCPLYYYHQKHPVNYLLLGLFTISLAFAVGLTCAFTSGIVFEFEFYLGILLLRACETGKVILESVILTTVVVVSLTLYTFWAARRGHDFNFLGPFLFSAVIILMVFAMIQIIFPLGRISIMIYGCLASLIFSGYIIYDTDNLIKRFSYDEYIWAAICLYLDIINLFLSLLTIFRATE
ncbi:BI1-like protein [Morella rubra]|uniref:BI1-like protein n=1 Tax=Morella rubra TaxID=262757 RepID=A0A6A1VVF5_9ROSI|nr:BI1-like protein [Morella rubra]KAB1216033.1 BI1-like protein [Morella rubra]